MARGTSKERASGPTPGLAAPKQDPTSVARWEWRIFARHTPLRELAHLATSPPGRSRERYLLSSESPHNAKIREGVLEIKQLDRTAHGGLERWHPTLRAPFPLSPEAVRAVCQALGVSPPAALPPDLTEESFVRMVVSPLASLRGVEVEKVRSRISFNDCPGELVSLRIEGDPWESLAFEHENPATVLEALRHLRLDVKQNTSYPGGLKRILGWPQGAKGQPRA